MAEVREYDENNKLIAVAPEQRGETMAFAVQQVLYNLGGNFFEPVINRKVQKYFSDHDAAHIIKPGSYGQNLAGEFAGDIFGATSLMTAEMLAPVQLHTLTRSMRAAIDPVYSKIAEHVFAGQEKDPTYAERKEEWKVAQERSLVRSAIMLGAGMVGNIGTQKLILNNPAPAKLIFLGKLASSAITNSIGLIVRAMAPETTKGMDKWMSKNVFTPLFEDKEEQQITR